MVPGKGGETVDEARAVSGRPGPPVRRLDAIAIAFSDIVRSGIDNKGDFALPFSAKPRDVVHVLGRELETTPAPFRHRFRIHGPERTFAPKGPG